jgi:hypothetical protein
MTRLFKALLLSGLLAISMLMAAAARAEIRVAVTDLAYEERVREYFRDIRATSKSSLRASARESTSASDHSDDHRDASRASRRASAAVDKRHASSFSYSEGTYSYIERGELRKFTADINGEMLKSGYFRIMQSKPYTSKKTENLHDIIARIRKGMFPGANYVLFGTVSHIAFRQEANPIDNTDTVSHTLSLELAGEFSLINTRTYEVKAAFSAMGEGQDVKLLSSAGGTLVLNRSKVIAEVSKSLGEDVIHQLEEQLASLEGYAPAVRGSVIEKITEDEDGVRVFR